MTDEQKLKEFCEFEYQYDLSKGNCDELDLPEDNYMLYRKPDDYFEHHYSDVVELFHAYHEYLKSKGE